MTGIRVVNVDQRRQPGLMRLPGHDKLDGQPSQNGELMAKRYDIAAVFGLLIKEEAILPGTELPSLESIAAAFDVAVGTVRAAFDSLDSDGLLVVQQGVRARVREAGMTRVGRQDVIDVFRGRIDRGELRPGDLLPSRADMAEEFGISESTAKQVVKVLREAGLVTISPNGQERRVAEGVSTQGHAENAA
jgi:DNA-binding GntR family transcriptional regulator